MQKIGFATLMLHIDIVRCGICSGQPKKDVREKWWTKQLVPEEGLVDPPDRKQDQTHQTVGWEDDGVI